MVITKVKWLLMLVSLTGITACGGGGSSGGTGTKSSTAPLSSSSAVTSSSSTTSSLSSSETSNQSSASSMPVVNNENPTVNILFPRQNARVDQATITVQGTATDDKGISSIKVNGVEASFQTVSSGANATKQSRDGTTVITYAKAAAEESITVNWTATIPLLFGQTDINVEVTDTEGGSIENSDNPIKLNNARVPLAIIKDSINHRFISFEQYPNIFSVDMTSLEMTRLPDSRYEQGYSLSTDASKIFSVTNDNGTLKVYSSKIATGHISLEATYDLQFDANQHNWISTSGTLSSDSKHYFVLAFYAFHDNSITTKILKADLETKEVTILSEKKDDNPDYKNLWQIVYADNYLIGIALRNDLNKDLIKIDVATGEQEVFIENMNFDHISISDNRESLYVISGKGFSKIKLSDKTIDSITFPIQEDMLEFAQPTAFVVDEEHNRLVVTDAGLGQLVSVDINSGELKFLTENGIGTGPKLVWPDQLDVTSNDKFAYVLDSRLEATEMLFKIDLATGNREVVSDLSIYADNSATALVLDETHNRIFVAFDLTIGVVDLGTGNHEIIANHSIGLGPLINGVGDMVYDNSEDRLLVTDLSQAFVVEIDLQTNERSILFDETIGSGPTFTPMSSIALNDRNNQLYLSTLNSENLEASTAVIAIDLESGNRTTLFDNCDGHKVAYKLNANLKLNPAKNTLTMLASNEIFEYDLANKTCKVLPFSAFDITYLSDSTLLGVMGHGLYQINPNNGERVIISQ